MAFELAESGTATLVRIVGEAKPKGPMRLLEPMMTVRMKPYMADVEKGIVRELA